MRLVKTNLQTRRMHKHAPRTGAIFQLEPTVLHERTRFIPCEVSGPLLQSF